MGVDHRGFDVCVAEQFLNGSNIVAVLEHMRGKRVMEGVAGGTLQGKKNPETKGVQKMILTYVASRRVRNPGAWTGEFRIFRQYY